MSSVATFISILEQSLLSQSFSKLVFSKPAAAAAADLRQCSARLVKLKTGLHLSCIYTYLRRDETKNYPFADFSQLVSDIVPATFLNADLITNTESISLRVGKRGTANITRNPTKDTNKIPVLQAHDQPKQRVIATSKYLHTLGIANAQGDILAVGQKKFKQINRYIELVGALLAERPLAKDAIIADMGCGKGYLTFALADYLQKKGDQTQVIGIELRPELVAFCNQLAQKEHFAHLRFEEGNINDYAPPRLDMLIALHACDTATDMAIAQGIRAGADIIVVAPCCQKQIRRDMKPPPPQKALLKHGILLERQAEMLTDGIRALLLEAHGYRVKVMEFISTEHTPKNLMIAATKATPRPEAFDEIAALKAAYGITAHALETMI